MKNNFLCVNCNSVLKYSPAFGDYVSYCVDVNCGYNLRHTEIQYLNDKIIFYRFCKNKLIVMSSARNNYTKLFDYTSILAAIPGEEMFNLNKYLPVNEQADFDKVYNRLKKLIPLL